MQQLRSGCVAVSAISLLRLNRSVARLPSGNGRDHRERGLCAAPEMSPWQRIYFFTFVAGKRVKTSLPNTGTVFGFA